MPLVTHEDHAEQIVGNHWFTLRSEFACPLSLIVRIKIGSARRTDGQEGRGLHAHAAVSDALDRSSGPWHRVVQDNGDYVSVAMRVEHGKPFSLGLRHLVPMGPHLSVQVWMSDGISGDIFDHAHASDVRMWALARTL